MERPPEGVSPPAKLSLFSDLQSREQTAAPSEQQVVVGAAVEGNEKKWPAEEWQTT